MLTCINKSLPQRNKTKQTELKEKCGGGGHRDRDPRRGGGGQRKEPALVMLLM